MFREELLHHIWRSGSFEVNDLLTACGKPVIIKHRGKYHHNSGPDFIDAELIIDGLHWVGSIEIHIKSSDWYRHQHEKDPQYASVILHVVWEYDVPVLHPDGTEIPALELKNRVSPEMLNRYETLKQSLDHIPCAGFLNIVPDQIKQETVSKAAEARMHKKAMHFLEGTNQQIPDWDELFYRSLMRSFGVPVNGDAFDQLSHKIPFKALVKWGNQKKIEAFLLGCAGFLGAGNADAYQKELWMEFTYLQKLQSCEPMPVHQWKFLRMRPASFPVFRLAQLAALISAKPRFFSEVIDIQQVDILISMFNAEASNYWKTHYRFGVQTSTHSTKLGQKLSENLIINTVAPALYAYGCFHQNQNMRDMALNLLCSIEPEENRYIRIWNSKNMRTENALVTQGLLHLMKNDCFAKQCLDCKIGQYIIDNRHGNQNR